MIELNIHAFNAIVEFAVAAALTFAILWLLQPVARRFGLLDRPDGRKDHAEPTPSTGGLAMLFGIVLALVIFSVWSQESVSYILAAALLVLIGLLDDRYDLRWWVRVIAQCAAVLVMVYGGVEVEHIADIVGVHGTGLGPLSVPFTMFATVGVINAINMIDGVDGLAGGIVLASLCMLESAALYSGNIALAEKSIVFIGAVFGFLMMNMRFPWQPRARVFMGNAGSALLGFTIAWVSFSLTQNYNHPVTSILAPWLVATPLIDCVSLLAHRLLRGQSPFHADREHMHHLMLDAGFTPTQLTLTLVAINLAMGLLASLALLYKVPLSVLVSVFIGLCLGYFWLTLRRERAVAAFASLNNCMARLHLKPKTGLAPPALGAED